MANDAEPISQQALVEHYEALRSRTRQMLASARDADWPALVDQESSYLMQVEQLATLEAGRRLDTEHRHRKATLLEEILENDLEIRARLIERRDELGELIGAAQRQRKLHRAYDVSDPGHGSRAR